VIQRQVDVQLHVIEDVAADVDALAAAEREKGFLLNAAPLFRLMLVRGAGTAWHLIFTSHHILMDGWSNAQLLGEVIAHYAGHSVPAPLGQFHDYLAWLQQQVPGEAFWKAALAPLQAPTLLAQALRVPAGGKGMVDHQVVLGDDFTRALSEFARHQKVTLNTVLQGAWSLLLQRYTGQDCVAFGATVAGRSAPLPGIEQQLGLFINTLPIISAASPALSVAGWLSELQALNLSLRDHEHVPLYDIQGWAGQQGAALFDTLLVFENFPVAEALKQGAPAGLTFGRLHNHEHTHYPLTLGIELGASLRLEFGYDQARFSAQQVARLGGNLQHLLVQMLADAQAPLGNLRLLDEAARRDVLALGQAPGSALRHLLVHERIAAQAAATPDALAVQAGDVRLSYVQLNDHANRLAHRLLELGVGPGQRVGLAARRGPQLIVSLLAVLKSGAAYVPLDPNYPVERLAYMLADSRLDLLLSETGLLADLPLPQGLERVCFTASGTELSGYPSTNPPTQAITADLAYVVYTSGSTGQPKGVAIDHAALGQFCDSAEAYSCLSAADRVLQFATFSFDGFVEQCYPPLCVGAALIMRGDELWDAGQLARQIIEQGVTLADLPAAYWYLLAKECAVDGRSLGNLRQVHVGGEAMSVEGLRAWYAAGLGNVRLVNTYGPTEATVVSSVHHCQLADASDAYGVPIGRAIEGRSLYVLDSGFELLATEGVGELCIGAEHGLAQRYFDRPALTAERFLPDPFCAVPGARLYRTGDLARYNEAGALEYVGRIDHQVKIRGFRVEMGEIEASLQALSQLREAAVIAQPGATGMQLVAYVVAANGQALDWQALAATLRQSLPDYMVPGHWVILDALPLNNNGKLDRRALPAPDLNQPRQAYLAPHNTLQTRLAAIWQAVLQVDQVGLNDHFFERGGHSLLATQVISRVRHDLKLEVPLRALFEQPTLEAFAAACAGLQADTAPALVAVTRDQPLALSFAQERQWFLWQLDPTSAAYHVPSALRLKGVLDTSALQRALDTLVARHESLRTHFLQGAERTLQVISPRVRIELVLADTDEASLKAQVEARIAQPFDLRQGPLMRASLLRLAEDEHVLVLVQHHIISDGWSMQVMVDELVQLYAAYSQGQDLQLPAMPIQYADFALWQREWMAAGERDRQLDYWRELLGGEQPVLELPFDQQRPAMPTHRGARLNITLPPSLVDNIKDLAQREGVTVFMVLLASYQALLHRYSGQQDIRVGVPIANRNRVETERLIGFFVNTQVLKAEIDGHTTVRRLLTQVKQRALEAQAHQDLPFEQLVEALQPERSLSLSPLFQVAFNHHISLAGQHLQRLAQLDMSPVSWDDTAAHFDLILDIEESRDQLGASLSYATDLFAPATIERMAGHWQNLLQAMVADQQQPISQLNLLGRDEQQHILQLWNQTDAGFSAERLVHERVADRAAENPHAVAVKFDAQSLSYGELDRQANRLAHALIARGVGPEVRVAIAMPRSAEIMVAFLAVLKAGGVYVPLDIEYPRDRLLYMMQDSRAQLLLTHTRALAQLPIPEGLDSLAIDRTEEWAGLPDTAPKVQLDGDNLAYVIYTSGSTGMPKGVAVSHGPLVAHIIATGERYETSPDDCELHFMSFAFDGSHEGWMHPLINGASVLIRDDSLWLPEYTYAQMHRHHVTMAVFPPVYLQQLAEHAERDGNPPKVRVYCFGGDAVAQASYDLAWRALKPTYLFNGYGPTETVVTPLLWKARKGDPCGAVYAPIGTLLGNRSGYVLDAQLNLQPIGVAGELYLGGEGVARGYLEHPALTAERFVPDPFGKPGSRVYRSGDLTRGRPDGVVDYLGRVDHQVKIRGFRIELGEIEARLREQDNVGETVVVAQDGPTGKQLVAYVVPANANLAGQAEFRDSLRRALKSSLPDYMVPTHFMFLAQMPLTPNGKLDRKGLPEPDASLLQQAFVAPETELERQIAAIWSDVLRLPQVGLNDNFFEVGGHSLLAIQITSRVQAELGLEVPLLEVFQTETLRAYVQAAATFRAGSAEDFDDLRDFLSELEAI